MVTQTRLAAAALALLLGFPAPTTAQQWDADVVQSWIDALRAAATGNCANILTQAADGVQRAKDTQGVHWYDFSMIGRPNELGWMPNNLPTDEAKILISVRFQPPASDSPAATLPDPLDPNRDVLISEVILHEGLHAYLENPDYFSHASLRDRVAEAAAEMNARTDAMACFSQVKHPMLTGGGR